MEPKESVWMLPIVEEYMSISLRVMNNEEYSRGLTRGSEVGEGSARKCSNSGVTTGTQKEVPEGWKRILEELWENGNQLESHRSARWRAPTFGC